MGLTFKAEKRNKQIAEQLLEKHVQEHIYRRLSARERTESEKVSKLNVLLANVM
jgi:hypothetical protein